MIFILSERGPNRLSFGLVVEQLNIELLSGGDRLRSAFIIFTDQATVEGVGNAKSNRTAWIFKLSDFEARLSHDL